MRVSIWTNQPHPSLTVFVRSVTPLQHGDAAPGLYYLSSNHIPWDNFNNAGNQKNSFIVLENFSFDFGLVLAGLGQFFLPICVVYGSLPTATSCEDADFYTTYTLNIDDFFCSSGALHLGRAFSSFVIEALRLTWTGDWWNCTSFMTMAKRAIVKKHCAKKIVWIYVKDTMLLSDIIRGATDDL